MLLIKDSLSAEFSGKIGRLECERKIWGCRCRERGGGEGGQTKKMPGLESNSSWWKGFPEWIKSCLIQKSLQISRLILDALITSNCGGRGNNVCIPLRVQVFVHEAQEWSFCPLGHKHILFFTRKPFFINTTTTVFSCLSLSFQTSSLSYLPTSLL